MQHSIGSGHVGRKIDRIGRHVEFRLRLENHAHNRRVQIELYTTAMGRPAPAVDR